jgi:hypothetical protein
MIKQLNVDEVFVFGSNATGFHGAGSAGLACRGTSANTWRTDNWFLAAMKSPVGSIQRIGKWAVYGVAQGHQVGSTGESYAICTIVKPGQKRSFPLNAIESQFAKMFEFATKNPQKTLLMTPVGCGYAGYTEKEMLDCWNAAIKKFGTLPANIVVPKDLYMTQPSVDMT